MSDAAAIARRCLSIRDVAVNVDLHGTGGASVVLLPGGAAPCAPYFPGLVEALSDATVVVHDRRGTGQTPSGADEVNLRTWSEDLISMLDELGVERAVLVGHSLGGALSAYLIRSHPTRVAAALLLDPTAVTDPGLCAVAARAASVLSKLIQLPWLGSRLERAFVRASTRGLSDVGQRAVEQTLVGDWVGDTARAVVHLVEDTKAFARLPSVSSPPRTILVAAGRRSPRAQRAHRKLASILGAELQVWDGARHGLHLERPEVVVALTRELVASARRPILDS